MLIKNDFCSRFFAFLGLFILSSNIALCQTISIYDIEPINGNTQFNYQQVPEDIKSSYNISGATYQWQQSNMPVGSNFVNIAGATTETYHFTTPLLQTTYFRRIAQKAGITYSSNFVKIQVVSLFWENKNYVREHTVLVPNTNNWQEIDQLPTGKKLQTTTYADGLGRVTQKQSKETALLDAQSNLWGDVVQINHYDNLGRQAIHYLPFTTKSQIGQYKEDDIELQTDYYQNTLQETSAFSTPTFDNSPLNRVLNVKSPGAAWAASDGNSVEYQINTYDDDVKIWDIAYTAGSTPRVVGIYLANNLYKTIQTDINGKLVIDYTNKNGQLILHKVQLAEPPYLGGVKPVNYGLTAYDGWICTYSIYDDLGRLRYRIQPEGVKWLNQNNWVFGSGDAIDNEQCFSYEYDAKGRAIRTKAPGAKALTMLYDVRNRVVHMQDGNQRATTPPQFTTNIYDELDRPLASTLYNTTKTTTQLQAAIDAAPAFSNITVATPQSISLPTYLCPLTTTELNSMEVTTILKYNFYDQYNFAQAAQFNIHYDNELAYPASNADPITPTLRTLSLATGSLTRVLGSALFLSTTLYYDDKGRPIQTTKTHIMSGTDLTTLQYHYTGRLLSSNTIHASLGTDFTKYSIVTKNNFDIIGRVTSIEKKFGENDFKTIASYNFDDFGRLLTKHLDPNFVKPDGSQDLENLTYSYNIQGNLTGINKDYALKTHGLYNKWGNYFGLFLDYDNTNGYFNQAQLNGQVTGTIWNTQGDDTKRKYDYTYDNAGRLTAALYQEENTNPNIDADWSNTQMDFSVLGSHNMINYDLNGNILNMIQKGVLIGNPTPVEVDNLNYTYASLSNKLLKVTDNTTTMGTANGKLGDFKDGTNLDDDYSYDANGNLINDYNKSARISYNYLDKPTLINIENKGVIKIIYDADGTKLQKIYTPINSQTSKVTSYISQYIYEETISTFNTTIPAKDGKANLTLINFEEGRIRVITPISQNNGYDALTINGNLSLPISGAGGVLKMGVFDYFIRDHQSNTRMILTQQTHIGSNSCTLETNRAANEEPLWGQVNAQGVPTPQNEVRARYPVANIPGQATGNGWANSTIGNYVSRVGALASSKMGPNTLLKVMAGDQISATTIYYYKNTISTQPNNGNTLITSLVASLVNALSGSSVATNILPENTSQIGNSLSNSPIFINASSPQANNDPSTAPKAYLTVLFFDERMNFIAENSGTQRVRYPGSAGGTLALTELQAPKNGYCYVYVSNESTEPVYFDNLQLTHNRGHIIEENHYYAYGLKIAALSSRKIPDASEANNIKNHYLYQGDFSEYDEDIAWNDFDLRNYDPQIGRWVQQDPYQEYPSPYTGMGNDPVNNIDPSGGGIYEVFGGAVIGALIGGVVDGASGGDGRKGAAIGALVGAAAGFIGSGGIHVSTSVATTALHVTQLTFKAVQVGNEVSKAVKGGPDPNDCTNGDCKNSLYKRNFTQQQISDAKYGDISPIYSDVSNACFNGLNTCYTVAFQLYLNGIKQPMRILLKGDPSKRTRIIVEDRGAKGSSMRQVDLLEIKFEVQFDNSVANTIKPETNLYEYSNTMKNFLSQNKDAFIDIYGSTTNSEYDVFDYTDRNGKMVVNGNGKGLANERALKIQETLINTFGIPVNKIKIGVSSFCNSTNTTINFQYYQGQKP